MGAHAAGGIGAIVKSGAEDNGAPGGAKNIRHGLNHGMGRAGCRAPRQMSTHSYLLSISHSVFERCLGSLLSESVRSILLPAGICRLSDRTEFLAARMPNAEAAVDPSLPTAVIRTTTSPQGLFLSMPSGTSPGQRGTAVMTIGLGPVSGRFTAVCFSSRGPPQIESVRVVGAGMPSLRFLQRGNELPPSAQAQIWSRTIGALGHRTWRTLRDLHIAIIGCGRSGSIVAHSLARFGLRQLTLIDGDRMEIHNLGEMDLATFADLGSSKAGALQNHLRQDAPHTE